jgi:hypothetical protein
MQTFWSLTVVVCLFAMVFISRASDPISPVPVRALSLF